MVEIFLIQKQAEMIYSGRKKAIVKKRNKKSYLSNDLILVTKKKGVGFALGKIKLSAPKIISAEDFKQLEFSHLINQTEKKVWWPGSKKFYYYPIREFQKFNRPRIIFIKTGLQSFSNLTGEDFQNELVSYNPVELSKNVLLDDWKIICAGYSSIMQGKNIAFSKEQVYDLGKQIYLEAKRRNILMIDSKVSNKLISKIEEEITKNLPKYKEESEFESMAKQSEREDQLVIFRPFFQEMPLRGRGIKEDYNTDSLMEIIKENWY